MSAALAACGGAGAPPEAPIHTVDDAEAALAHAERELRNVVAAAPQPQQQQPPTPTQPGQLGQGPDQPPQPAPPPPEPANVRVTREDGSGQVEAKSEPPCTTACRALASMRRATERLCALAPGGDARCTAAKQRTQQAEADVRRACGGC